MVLQGANSIGNTKKSENCFNLSSFWVGGFLGWFPKTVLPDISVQLLALDGVAVNPIQYQLIFWPYNGVQSFNNRHIFYILTPAPLPPKKSDGWMIYYLVEIFEWGCQLHGAKNMENQSN